MSSATSDPNFDDVRSQGAPDSRERERSEYKRGTERKLSHRVRNVRPLPVTPPPRVVTPGTSPTEEPKPLGIKKGLDVEIRARAPASLLRRSSRVRGMGTAVTLIVGMILLIVLAVALIFALDSDSAPTNSATGVSGSSSPNKIHNADAGRSADRSNDADNLPVNQNANGNMQELNLDDTQPSVVSFAGAENSRAIPPTSSVGQAETPPDAAALTSLPTSHIIDDGEARLTGAWNVANRNREEYAGVRYHGEGFRIDFGTFGDRATAQYNFPPLRPGTYRVLISYPAGPNRASNVVVVVTDADGKHEVTVDQTVPPGRGKFLEIGEFRIDARQSLIVRFDNEGGFGFLAIDAVKAERIDHR
ncbi:MAG: hypothetical protein MPJ50_02790 [Pirellulales bacterium]|nr:hypothetical protein [Pirellulales bacterium]